MRTAGERARTETKGASKREKKKRGNGKCGKKKKSTEDELATYGNAV